MLCVGEGITCLRGPPDLFFEVRLLIHQQVQGCSHGQAQYPIVL